MSVDSQEVAITRRTRLFTRGDLTAGATSGLVGGIVMGVVAMIISGMIREDIDFWSPIKQVSGWYYGPDMALTGFDAGPVFIGSATHLVASIIFGVLFAVIYRRILQLPFQLGLPFLLGGAYGLLLWALANLYLPMFNRVMAEADKPAFILGHLAYGISVGIAYAKWHPMLPRRGMEPESTQASTET